MLNMLRFRDWEKHGLTASLEHQLWEVLKLHQSGLPLSELTSKISAEDSKVRRHKSRPACLTRMAVHHVPWPQFQHSANLPLHQYRMHEDMPTEGVFANTSSICLAGDSCFRG